MKLKLAIHGGKKAVVAKPPYNWPDVTKEEILEVMNHMVHNNISIYDRAHPLGTLEDDFKELTGRKYAIAYNSGTSALLATFYGVSLQEGDEVIVPSYTFWATVTPLVRLGVIPIFAEIDPETLTLSPEGILDKITTSTKAIVVNHTWGNPANLDEILKICKENQLTLIEDASHSHGGTYDQKPIGSFGKVAAFSLQANKPVAAGEGGILVTNSVEVYERATLLGHFGPRSIQTINLDQYAPFAETGIGYKMRIAALSAAVGLTQLKTLKERNKIRRENMQYLSELIKDLPGLKVPIEQPKGKHIYYGYKIVIKPEAFKVSISEIVETLKAEGVKIKQADPHMLHKAPLFNDNISRTPLGWPFSNKEYCQKVDNKKICLPITEDIVYRLLSVKPLVKPALNVIEEYANAFRKVWEWALK
ncbi:hypothetical protein CVT91_07040 [Candidatus Atribacteria bacterium HGW-Atribacteria-1]|nr:MAG: hypothetical protein CVT91_07040 [Candidatus Atribacteria bacterium HGW-Atribacteria-1]